MLAATNTLRFRSSVDTGTETSVHPEVVQRGVKSR